MSGTERRHGEPVLKQVGDATIFGTVVGGDEKTVEVKLASGRTMWTSAEYVRSIGSGVDR